MAKPVPLGTLFELPLESFGVDAAHDSHITAAALQELDLDDVGEATTNGGAALPTAAPKPTGPTCIACGIGVEGAPGFASAEEQRRHFSLDWHRYNIKRRAAGRERVSKGDFEALLEDERQEVGSISGSESEHSGDEDDEDAAHGLSATAAGPQFAFIAADGKRYAVWRPLLAPDRERSSGAPPPASQCLAALRRLREQGARWAVVMLRGGHFAAAVFGVDPARASNTRQPDKFEVLAHKSAHRYVVRAGQGGKQSAKDASGKYARSAGSRLRRYNEAALQRDVAEALAGWRELLAGCDLVFVHAPSSNWQQLFGGDAPLLDGGDERVRRVPFTTRRPTFSETKRIMRVLVTLYQLPDAEAGREQQQQQRPQQAAAAAGQQQEAAARQDVEQAPSAAAAAAAAAAAEEEARRKKAEKRARQKARQKEERQAEAAASKAAAEEAARQAVDDEIGRAAVAVAAMGSKLTAKPPPVSGTGAGKASGSGGVRPPKLSAKPRPNEGAEVRRARLAAAAEARMKALQEAAKQQQLH